MTLFSVWAPRASSVEVRVLDVARPMHESGGGWWALDAADTGHGTDYAFLLDGGDDALPDPRSLRQPQGVHGPSQVYEHDRFGWTDAGWRGIPLAGSVIYELHIGTFTEAGTLDSALGRIDHLVDLGVDLVELMPVGAFPGVHGWGYDGVDVYAVHEPYGGPDGLKRFVDGCHARGLGVLLDVVYNHLGPSGNYLQRFGPYFTDRYTTPWGPAVNLDGDGSHEVRRWVIDNALMWLRDYHLDGLRLDAVHALVDGGDEHLLSELSREVDTLAAQLGRTLLAIAESDENQPSTVEPRECGGLGMTAAWDDDYHHALHVLLTGERQGYYADFAADPCAALRKTLTEVFFHNGTWSSFRGAVHGAAVTTDRVPGWRFVCCLQDHDQVGNRAVGDRITASVSPGLVAAGAALLLTAPFTPMLFMGEEWAASTPWQFFTDHQEPELAEAVRTGRQQEFAHHGWSEAVPDPQSHETMARSRLDWSEPTSEPHRRMLTWYRDLIALRRAEPDLADSRIDRVVVECDLGDRWVVVHRGEVRVVCNLAGVAQAVPLDSDVDAVLLAWAGAEPSEGRVLVLDAESAAVVRVPPKVAS